MDAMILTLPDLNMCDVDEVVASMSEGRCLKKGKGQVEGAFTVEVKLKCPIRLLHTPSPYCPFGTSPAIIPIISESVRILLPFFPLR